MVKRLGLNFPAILLLCNKLQDLFHIDPVFRADITDLRFHHNTRCCIGFWPRMVNVSGRADCFPPEGQPVRATLGGQPPCVLPVRFSITPIALFIALSHQALTTVRLPILRGRQTNINLTARSALTFWLWAGKFYECTKVLLFRSGSHCPHTRGSDYLGWRIRRAPWMAP